jgi:hypothetical protein
LVVVPRVALEVDLETDKLIDEDTSADDDVSGFGVAGSENILLGVETVESGVVVAGETPKISDRAVEERETNCFDARNLAL